MLPLHQSPMAEQQLRSICLSAQGGSRTRKTTVLSRVPMPIRLLGRMVRTEGLEPSRTRHMILSHGCLPFHHVRLFIVRTRWPFSPDYQHFLRSLTSQLRSITVGGSCVTGQIVIGYSIKTSGGPGWNRTNGVSVVTVLQTAAFASWAYRPILNWKNTQKLPEDLPFRSGQRQPYVDTLPLTFSFYILQVCFYLKVFLRLYN